MAMLTGAVGECNRVDYALVSRMLMDIIESGSAMDITLSKDIRAAMANHPDFPRLVDMDNPSRRNFKNFPLKFFVQAIAPDAYTYRNANYRGFGGVRLKKGVNYANSPD